MFGHGQLLSKGMHAIWGIACFAHLLAPAGAALNFIRPVPVSGNVASQPAAMGKTFSNSTTTTTTYILLCHSTADCNGKYPETMTSEYDVTIGPGSTTGLEIGPEAFRSDEYLRKVIIPDYVTTVGKNAFVNSQR